MNTRLNKSKKGVALIWVLLTCLVLFVLTTNISTTIIKESRMTLDISNSGQAYAAARSGYEWAMVQVDNECQTGYWDGTGPLSRTVTIGTTRFIVYMTADTYADAGDPNNRCDTTYHYQLAPHGKKYLDVWGTSSLGTPNEVNRKLHYDIGSESYSGVADPVAAIGTPVDHSFGIKFNFWDNATATEVGIGLKDPTSNNMMVFTFQNGQVGIKGKNNGTAFATAWTNLGLTAAQLANPYALTVNLRYVDHTGIILQVYDKQSSTCYAQVTYPTVNWNFGSFTNYYYEVGNSAYAPVGSSTVTGTDGYVYVLQNGYFDNLSTNF